MKTIIPALMLSLPILIILGLFCSIAVNGLIGIMVIFAVFNISNFFKGA